MCIGETNQFKGKSILLDRGIKEFDSFMSYYVFMLSLLNKFSK